MLAKQATEDKRPPLSPKSQEAARLMGLVLPEATDMCISSSSSSSSLLSPVQRERILRRASHSPRVVIDCTATPEDAADTTVFQLHKDGLLNRNKVPFAEIDFCFVCECDLRAEYAHATLECTGMKLDRTHYQGETVRVYRQLFTCDKCYVTIVEARKKDAEYRVRMASRALAYFR